MKISSLFLKSSPRPLWSEDVQHIHSRTLCLGEMIGLWRLLVNNHHLCRLATVRVGQPLSGKMLPVVSLSYKRLLECKPNRASTLRTDQMGHKNVCK